MGSGCCPKGHEQKGLNKGKGWKMISTITKASCATFRADGAIEVNDSHSLSLFGLALPLLDTNPQEMEGMNQ